MKETRKSNKKEIPIVPGTMMQSRNNSPILNNADLLEFAEAYRRPWEIPPQLQHMAEEIERNPNRFADHFVKALPVAKLRMQLAFGSTVEHFLPRQDVPGGGTEGWSLHRRMISRTANFLARFFLRLPVNDTTGEYRALSKRAALTLVNSKMGSRGYDYCVESLLLLKKSECSVSEVPFVFKQRKTGES